MFVEFNNISQGKAYYAVGGLHDLHAIPYVKGIVLTDCGPDNVSCFERIGNVIDRLTDVDPGDSFQVRLFTMDPSSLVLTERIMTRGIYWANYHRSDKKFLFEKVDR